MRLFNGIPCPAAVNGTIAAGAVGANTTADDTVNVPGARVGDHVVVTPIGAWDAGMMSGGGRVSAAGVVTVRAMNTTAAPLPAADVAYQVIVLPRD